MIAGTHINTALFLIFKKCALFLIFNLLKVLPILTKKGLGVIRFYNMNYAITEY